MQHYQSAIKLIMRNMTGRHTVKGPPREIRISIPSGEKPADAYEPLEARPHGTIMLIHGMTLRGQRDPRLQSLCRALAGSGYITISPNFADVAALEVRCETIQDVIETAREVCEDKRLCPTGRLSLFAPSFSGGMALIAAAHPTLAARVNSVCTIGTLGHIDSTLQHLLGRENIDYYGMNIMFKNFLRYSVGDKRELIKAFDLAARDGSHEPETLQLPAHLETMTREDRELFERLRNEPALRLEHLERILPKMTDVIDAFSIVTQIDGMRAAVTLIHGEGDLVIPPSESRFLHERFTELGVTSRLEITPLVSHGHTNFSLSMIPKAIRLLSAFAHFFKYARG